MCGSLNHNLDTTFDLGFSVRSGGNALAKFSRGKFCGSGLLEM